MNYFKNTNNEIFAYDDEQLAQVAEYNNQPSTSDTPEARVFPQVIVDLSQSISNLTPITEAELAELQKPIPEQQLEIDKQSLKSEREQYLSELTHVFKDGSIVQVRPKDLPNFQIATAIGQPEEWVMADDSVRLLTVEEMTEAMNSGIVQAKDIWNDYTTKLKTL